MASCSHVGLAPWAWLSIARKEAWRPLARWHEICTCSIMGVRRAGGGGGGGGGGVSLASIDPPFQSEVTLHQCPINSCGGPGAKLGVKAPTVCVT